LSFVTAVSLTAFAEQASLYSPTTEVEKTDTLKEVVVTGTNNATKVNHIPFSISTVTSEQIEATGRTQLLSALSGRIPSLFVTERNIFGFGISNGGSGSIKVRGVGGSPTSQVLMMVDGKPQFAGVFSHPAADLYESDFVDHVEIVRGPASVLYGSNAMGGAINVITKSPKEQGIRTTIQSQYGSYNTWQNNATTQMRFGKFSSVLSAGYDRTDGTVKDFDFWQASAYAKIGYDFSDHWNMYADYALMKFVGNDPIYPKLSDPESTNIYHQDILRGEASVVTSNKYANTNGSVRLYYSHGNHNIQDPKDFQMLDDRIGVLAYQNYQPWKMTNVTLGFDFNRYSGKVPLSGGVYRKDKVTPTTMDRQTITEYSPYLTAQQGICNNMFVINAGLRVANSNMFGTHLLPQAGFTINPGKEWTVKASLAKGYRNPSFKELYLYKMANPDLKPEKMMNYEVSVSKSFSHWATLELTGYIAKGSNLINTIDMKNVNTGEFTNKGIELSVTSRPAKQLNLRGTYSFLHSSIDNLTGAPKHQYSFAADWNIIPKLTLNADVVGASQLFVAKDVEMQNYALLNMKVTYHVVKMLDVFVQGNNITDARYCINKGYEMPGISVSGGIKIKF